jgi:hypothetical protein
MCFPLICIAFSSPYSGGERANNFPVIIRPSTAMYGHTISRLFDVTSIFPAMLCSSFAFLFVAVEFFKIIQQPLFYL